MENTFGLSGKTVVREMILWTGGVTILTLLLVGVFFYQFTTASMLNNLREQSQVTVDEITRVLAFPLYNLDDKAAINIADVYLSSGRLYGISVESKASGILVDRFLKTNSMVAPIERKIDYKDIPLGSVRILMSDEMVRSVQKNTSIIIFTITLVILIVYVFLLSIVFRRVLITPLEKLIEGIQRFGRSDFSKEIEMLPHQDLNHLVTGLNSMASSIEKNQLHILESEKKYSSIFNSSFVGILLCSFDLTVLDVNETAVSMFGVHQKEELLGKRKLDQLLVREYNEVSVNSQLTREKFSEGTSFNWMAESLADDKPFHVEISVKVMTLQDDEYLVVNLLDTTARKEAEQKLVQTQKLEAIGVLAGGLAHDFNNVLGGITGHVSLMKLRHAQNKLNDEDFIASATQIEEATLRASSVINQLMTFSKRNPVQAKPVDLNQLVFNVVKLAENSFDKSIEISVRRSGNEALVMADDTQIEQVLLNLMVNGAHAMTIMRPPEDQWGGKLSIEVIEQVTDQYFKKSHPLAVEDQYWCIRITDTGVGMSKNDQTKIYVPFYSTKDKSQGTGLGLAMVFSILEDHKGFIDVYSEKNLGSSFAIYIPKYKGSLSREDRLTSRIQPYRGSGLALIIDDDDTLRETTARLLEEFGFTTLVAANGREGIDLFRQNRDRVSIVILDMVMPKLSGRETYLELRKLRQDIKVILISGFTENNRVKDLLDLGIQAFLQKPFTDVQMTRVLYDLDAKSTIGVSTS